MEEPSSYYNLPLAVDCTLSLGSTSSTTVARIAPDHDLSWSLAVRSNRTCEPSEPAMSWPGSLDAAVSPDYYSQVEGREAWPSDKSVKTSTALFSMIESSHSYGHRSSRQPGWLTSYTPSADVKEGGERVCAHCGTSKTPLWRNGPNRPKSLCNACGIRFKKAGRRSGDLPPSPKATKARKSELPRKPQSKRSRAGSDSVSCMTWQAPKSTASSQQDLLGSYSSDEEEGAVLLMALSCGMVNA